MSVEFSTYTLRDPWKLREVKLPGENTVYWPLHKDTYNIWYYQGRTLSDPYIRIHIYGIIVRKDEDNGKFNKLTKIVLGCIVLIRKCWAKKIQATDKNSFQVLIKISAFENPTQPPKLWASNSQNSALSHQKWNLKPKDDANFFFLWSVEDKILKFKMAKHFISDPMSHHYQWPHGALLSVTPWRFTISDPIAHIIEQVVAPSA